MTYIATIVEMRTVCQLSANVETRKLTAGLDIAHVWMEQKIGKSCYDAFIAAIAADPTLASGPNVLWLNLKAYAKPYLCWLAYFHSLTFLHSEPDREGFFAKSGGDYQSVDGRTLGTHERINKDRYQLYETRMMQFLKDNPTVYTCLTAGDHPPTVRTDQTYPGGIITEPSIYARYSETEIVSGCDDCPDPTTVT